MAAPAATVAIVGGDEVRVTAAAGEDNNLTFARSGANFLVTDSGVAPTAGVGCALGEGGVLCPAAGIADLTADLDDLDDDGTVAASIEATGSGFFVSLRGGDGSDTLNGGPNTDTQLGGDAGNDVLNGSGGNDRLLAGLGEDVSTGGPGDDRFDASDGNDVGNGGPGNDFFAEGTTLPNGADTFVGGPGVDELQLQGRQSNLAIDADGVADDGSGCPGAGCENDDVRADIEIMQGGRGNDVIVGSGVANALDGFIGNDTIRGAGGPDDLTGNDDDDVLRGGAGDDELDGDDGADRLFGEAGDDLFDDGFGSGTDSYSGGAGADTGLARSDFPQRTRSRRPPRRRRVLPWPRVRERQLPRRRRGPERRQRRRCADREQDSQRAQRRDRRRPPGRAGGADGLEGGAGGDRMVGGSGRDSIDGGTGADRVDIRDRARDLAFCGAARDSVTADARDQTGIDCERVRRGRGR